jgi:hypothetical protein
MEEGKEGSLLPIVPCSFPLFHMSVSLSFFKEKEGQTRNSPRGAKDSRILSRTSASALLNATG